MSGRTQPHLAQATWGQRSLDFWCGTRWIRSYSSLGWILPIGYWKGQEGLKTQYKLKSFGIRVRGGILVGAAVVMDITEEQFRKVGERALSFDCNVDIMKY